MGCFCSIVITVLSILFSVSACLNIINSWPRVSDDDWKCEDSDPYLELTFGIIVFILCIIGTLGAWRCSRRLMLTFMCMLLIALVSMVADTAFFYKLIKESPSISNMYKRNYTIEDFNPSLRTLVISHKVWARKTKCMTEMNFCKDAPSQIMQHAPESHHLVGCCRLPRQCENLINNETTLHSDNSFSNIATIDCVYWAVPNTTYCFNCFSCMAGALATYVLLGRIDIIVNCIHIAFVLFLVFISYVIFRDINKKLRHKPKPREGVGEADDYFRPYNGASYGT